MSVSWGPLIAPRRGLCRVLVAAVALVAPMVALVAPAGTAAALTDFSLVAENPEDAKFAGADLAEVVVTASTIAMEEPFTAGSFRGVLRIRGALADDMLTGTVVVEVTSTDNYGTVLTRVTEAQFTTTTIGVAGDRVEFRFGTARVTDNLSGTETTRETELDQVILYTVVPAGPPAPPVVADPEGFVEDVTGTTFYSPAEEADLEPSARTWIPLQPGVRVPMGAGAMLRTGVGGSVAFRFASGSFMRLEESSLFRIGPPVETSTSQAVIYGRMWEGFAFYWSKGTDATFEVETDRARVTIDGTVWRLAVTTEATVVSVFEGSVQVTDLASGTVTALDAGRTVTVDQAGATEVSNESLGLVAPQEEPLLITPAPGDTDGGTDDQATGFGLGMILVLVVAGVAVAAVVGAVWARSQRRPPRPGGAATRV